LLTTKSTANFFLLFEFPTLHFETQDGNVQRVPLRLEKRLLKQEIPIHVSGKVYACLKANEILAPHTVDVFTARMIRVVVVITIFSQISYIWHHMLRDILFEH